MTNSTVEAVLRLSAKLGDTRALGILQRELGKVDRQVKAFNRGHAAASGALQATQAAMLRYAAPAALAHGAKEAVVQLAAVERRVGRIAINAEAGAEAPREMMEVINRTASQYAMSQDRVTTGLESLVAAGRTATDALKFLPSVTATAQASGSAIEDIATTADALGTSFKISGDKMQGALDILVAGGKMGKFELRDMAQYLPSLSPAFSALGYKGEHGLSKLVAILQTVRQGTGDSSEAATAAANIFQKMESEETVKKFRKMGVDLRGTMKRARADGRDLLDVFLELTDKATGGDMSKLPQLFTDAEFAKGMRALMQGRADLDKFAAALKSVDGTTMRDLNEVLADTQTRIDRMSAKWSQFVTNFGGTIAGPASTGLDWMNDQLEQIEFVNRAVEKRGLSTWETLTTPKEVLLRWAYDEGYRAPVKTPDGMIAGREIDEKGDWQNSPELASRRQEETTAIPLPTPRPTRPGESVPVLPVPISSGADLTAEVEKGRAERHRARAQKRLDAYADGGGAMLPKPFDPARFGVENDLDYRFRRRSESIADHTADAERRRVVEAEVMRRMAKGPEPVDYGGYLRQRETAEADPTYARRERLAEAMMAAPSGSSAAGKMPDEVSVLGTPPVSISGTPTVISQPSGVQQVQVMNPPPAPQVNVSVSVQATTNADPAAIGAQVAQQVGQRVSAALSGVQADTTYAGH